MNGSYRISRDGWGDCMAKIYKNNNHSNDLHCDPFAIFRVRPWISGRYIVYVFLYSYGKFIIARNQTQQQWCGKNIPNMFQDRMLERSFEPTSQMNSNTFKIIEFEHVSPTFELSSSPDAKMLSMALKWPNDLLKCITRNVNLTVLRRSMLILISRVYPKTLVACECYCIYI